MGADLVTNLCRSLTGLIFLWGGIGKLINFPSFRAAIGNYGIVGTHRVPIFGLAVCLAETGVGAGLLFQHLPVFSAYVAIGLLVIFTMAILIAISRGQTNLPCGCSFLGTEARTNVSSVIRNLILIGIVSAAIQPHRAFTYVYLSLGVIATIFAVVMLHEKTKASRSPCASCTDNPA